MKDFADNSDFFPFRLDRKAKTLLWSCVVPLVLAGNCIFMQKYLDCGSFYNAFDFSANVSSSLFELTGLPFLRPAYCRDHYTQIFYNYLGFSIYFFIGLSIILPVIVYSRRRPVQETKLFE